MNSERRKSHKAALLEMLKDHRVHGMRECLEVGGFRYGGRLHELRRDGWVIDTIPVAPDEYAYRLVPESELQGALPI